MHFAPEYGIKNGLRMGVPPGASVNEQLLHDLKFSADCIHIPINKITIAMHKNVIMFSSIRTQLTIKGKN